MFISIKGALSVVAQGICRSEKSYRVGCWGLLYMFFSGVYPPVSMAGQTDKEDILMDTPINMP